MSPTVLDRRPVLSAGIAAWVVCVGGTALLLASWSWVSSFPGLGSWSLAVPEGLAFAGGCAVAVKRREGLYVRGAYLGILLALVAVVLAFLIGTASLGD